MEQEEIKALLDRFYSGTTTIEDEDRLKECLADPACSHLYPNEKEYFNTQNLPIPEPSDEFLISLEAITQKEKKLASPGLILRYSISLAAGIALLVGSYFLIDYLRPHDWSDTYTDPALAMAEVKAILTTVSSNMKTGTEPLSSMKTMTIAPETMKDLGMMNDILGKNLDKLRYLNNLNTPPKTNGNDNY
jgi:hypothetical protein